MNISFIVTAFDVAAWLPQCLETLGPCLRAGDQVILVDDGSSDGSAEICRNFAWPGVEVVPVLIGTNTPGGVGIPANIGLNHATRDAVFFLDGDDYLNADGFLRARAVFDRDAPDILICNYLEHDETTGQQRSPADAARWDALGRQAARDDALGLIAVPWRKFYRRDFLTRHGLRFPEGDFFFEDNPFHWQVCCRASRIGFFAGSICHHRVNRPGQTMQSTGAELAAFFTHYETIVADLPQDEGLHRLAAQWLMSNLNWHPARLAPAGYVAYARRAAQVLPKVPDALWDELAALPFIDNLVWLQADRLRQGAIWDVVEAWTAARRHAEVLAAIAGAEARLSGQVGIAADRAAAGLRLAEARQHIDEFAALQALGRAGNNRD